MSAKKTPHEMLKAGECEGCGEHDHDVLVLNQRCHPGMAVKARLIRSKSVVVLSCFICEMPICELKVVL